MKGYSNYSRNSCIGFQATFHMRQRMPVLQTIPPANIYAIVNDHDYLAQQPEEKFLQSICVSKIIAKDTKRIEEETRGQVKTNKWHTE